MIKHLYIIIFIFLFVSCDHPDTKKFERNQGSVKEHKISSKINDANNSGIESQSDRNELKMEVQDGVRYVWIEINGIRLRFIFDTGASSICISPAEATVLYRQGTLQKEDILDVQSFQDATGRISEGMRVNLREVKVGNMILENVQALIVNNVNAPLLLGQSVFKRFGSIEIDNDNGVIIFK